MAAPKLTPMMEQYLEVRRSLPANTLLLFRLGDFYEMFHEDAEEGARLLGITLTRRNDYPMAGIPYHAAETYINKLLAVGKKVAVCDQTETPQPGKLVRRALTRILSPGTTLGEDQLESRKNHYIAAIDFPARGGARLAWMDLSTGEFMLAAEDHPGALLPVLASIDPAEILVSEEASWITPPPPGSHPDPVLAELRDLLRGRTVTELPASRFERPAGARAVLEALGVLNLEGFGLALDHSALGAAGAVVAYVTENLRARPENLRTLREYRSTTALQLDPATLRNLEIFRSIRGGREGSLLHAIDRTLTPGGARLLEQWLIAPSLDLAELRRRHAAIGAFLLH
ncbi:MAG: DNA mismatch repair protein MutS, partial [Puniceicoccaceae bacterium]